MDFVTIDGATGLGQLILQPAVYRRCRAALHAAPLHPPGGEQQRRGPVANLLAMRVAPWPSVEDASEVPGD